MSQTNVHLKFIRRCSLCFSIKFSFTFLFLFSFLFLCCRCSCTGERPEAMQTGTSTYQVNKHYIAHTLLVSMAVSVCNIFRDHYSSILFHSVYQLNLITDDITQVILFVWRHIALSAARTLHRQSQRTIEQFQR